MAAPMSKSALSFPHVKLLAYHLKTAKSLKSDGLFKTWSYCYNNSTTLFSFAWVQGEVAEVNLDDESVIVKDDTGKVKLINCRLKIDSIEDLYVLETGQYVMAVGELVDNLDIPTIKIQKLKAIHENRQQLASLWPLEVQHQLKFAVQVRGNEGMPYTHDD